MIGAGHEECTTGGVQDMRIQCMARGVQDMRNVCHEECMTGGIHDEECTTR